MSKLVVGLSQIGNEFSDGQCYLPPSLGYLQAYAQEHARDPSKFEFLEMIYKRIPVEVAVSKLLPADIVGISVYVWNFELSCAIARELKRLKPEITIIFGGPHVPDGLKKFGREKKSANGLVNIQRRRKSFTQIFHEKYPFVDVACHGEGETVFLNVLERKLDSPNNWDGIYSVSYRRADGIVVQIPRGPRIVDLAMIPSPYQAGTFKGLMKAFPEQKWIVLLETNRGCPYACTFCDWGGAVEDKLNKFPLDRVFKDIDWIGRNNIRYTFIADANFGILERDVQIAEEFAKVKAKYSYPKAVSTQNAKNPKEHSFKALSVFENSGLKTAGIMSLQSVNEATLKAIRRDNMKVEKYQENREFMATQGTLMMSDMIMALPEETYDSFAGGISMMVAGGQHNRIHFNVFTILPNAEAADPEYMDEHGLKTVSTKILTIHGKKEEIVDGIDEWQESVVATKTMPGPDWIRTRVFTWMISLLHFNKVLQIPLIVMNKLGGIGYQDLIELFSEGNYCDITGQRVELPMEQFPILTDIRKFFLDKATSITQGNEEYCHSKEWLDIWWPADEYAMIKLCVENKLDGFYQEAKRALNLIRSMRLAPVSSEILNDAISLNSVLLKTPFQNQDVSIQLSYNIWEFYQDVLMGQKLELKGGLVEYKVDRTSESWDSIDDWCTKVVWWCNRNGAYLYTTKPVESVPSGHY